MSKLLAIAIAWLMIVTSAFSTSLRGSHASQEMQAFEAKRSNLSYIADDEALERMKKGRFLVPIPVSKSLIIDSRLDSKWHYVRPWTAKFLADLSRDFYKEFGEPLQVNSAVRTVERQIELRKQGNGNAAAHTGKRRSSHPTGASIDIAKLGRTGPQIKWLTLRLLKLEQRGLIEATEEHRQVVFHIMVFEKYGVPKRKKTDRH